MVQKRHNDHTKRLMAAFVVSLVMVLVLGFFSIESGRRFTRALDSGEKHFRAIASAATQVSSFAKRAEGHLMLYLSFHGEIDRKKISERLASLHEQIAILDRLIKAPKAREVVEKIKLLEKNILSVLPPLLTAYDREAQTTGGFKILNHRQTILDAHDFFSETRELGVQLAEIEFGLEQEFKTRLSLTVEKMRISFYLVFMGILMFLIVTGIFLIRINHRLNREILYREQAQLALEESEKNLQILSGQTEQLSLAAAETISMKDKKLVFQRISNAIVDHTDYQRVIISLFKETFPYRDIVGYAGIEEDKIAHLRSIAFPKSWYDGVFEQGIQVGHFSYYVPHKMKHILNQDAVVYGQGPELTEENTWHPQDNLFVRMNDENGQFIGVISVDDAKSGKAPCDKTLRPLEIFSSLISQIIILKREQEEKKKIEARLQQAIKMESIGTLTGGIAHDFNNILGIVLGNTELALGDMRQDHPARTRLEEIKHSCLRAADIVRQLSSFSRKTGYNPSPLKIVPAVEETLKFLRSIIPATVEFNTQYLDPDAVVMADPIQINQIIMNLCINSHHAMDQEKGSIHILVKKGVFTAKEVEIYPGMEPGEHVNIIFSDTGTGIPREILDRIFDPYFTTKPVGKGSGMGLAVVAGILKAHKGGIQVDSEPGKGSRFSIFLPATSLLPLPKVHESKRLSMGTESILLVDDDPAITRIFEKILQQLGYKALIFNDPLEALGKIRSDPDSFDLVITDMVMPQMTGADLARQIQEVRKTLPIIICTGHNDLIDDQMARETGIAALIMKPFAVQEISSAIRNALDKNKTTSPH